MLGNAMPLRMRIHDRETIAGALRRFKKLLERSGMQKELRKRRHYEKPSEVRRRSKARKQAAARKALSKATRY
jgi:small subunit ribosomal protein S21